MSVGARRESGHQSLAHTGARPGWRGRSVVHLNRVVGPLPAVHPPSGSAIAGCACQLRRNRLGRILGRLSRLCLLALLPQIWSPRCLQAKRQLLRQAVIIGLKPLPAEIVCDARLRHTKWSRPCWAGRFAVGPRRAPAAPADVASFAALREAALLILLHVLQQIWACNAAG